MTTELTKGANAPIPAGDVRVEVRAPVSLDVSALMLDESGKVRSDDDFIFYNQPNAPGVRYTAHAIEIDPGALPPPIERVVVTASLDGRGPSTFGEVGWVTAAVSAGGVDAVTFPMDGLGAETALLCVEIYSRQGTWKVRAVGQGWASGLSGIATAFGITVEDEPPPPSILSTPPPPSPPPPLVESVQKVSLDKGKVTLAKRQTVSLTKGGAAAFERVAMALGWDPAQSGRSIDLDASVVVLGRGGKKVDTAWFMSKKAMKGAVRHSGDNLTGAGDGDDETIEVDLNKLPQDVEALVFTVNSFQGQKFTQVSRAFCRLVDRGTNQELVRFDLTDSKPSTGVIMAVVHRAGATWEMTAIGEFRDGKTVRQMVGPAEAVWRELNAER